MEILIRPDAAAVACQAADIIEPYVRAGAALGMATGSTPVATYRELIRRHREESLNFRRCSIYMLDEYLGLPADHEQSYAATIRRELTEHVDIPDRQVFSPNGNTTDPVAAAADYENQLLRARVSMQLLGVGANGHIGFNEPTSSLNSPTRIKALHPQTVADNARFFDGREDLVPKLVLTQGLGTIQRAGHLVLVATGAAKADAVAALAEGPLSAMCPASVLQLHPHATVIVDEAAAAGLKLHEYYRFADAQKLPGQGY